MTANQLPVSRGQIVNGQYRLEKVLGQGGMGTVWTACDLRLDRLVAVKFLGGAATDEAPNCERFAREARMASRIRSPHVAQIIADGVTGEGVPFVVMELLDGESLAAQLARAKRCTLAATGTILEQVCRALCSTHSAGLVHRDIKPANIFLTPQATGDVFVRLLDFGIAKELWSGAMGLTGPGEMLGTIEYMSPEQLRSPKQVGAATDIWSLGVVVYEMLVGHSPFSARSLPEVAVRIATGKFSAASQICPELPPALDAVLARALSVQADQRYAKVEEFGAEFLRIVRAHTSTSKIRPDVLRALQATSETKRIEPAQTTQTTRLRASLPRERIVGGLLIVGCLLSLLAAWQLTAGPTDSATTPEALVAPAPLQAGQESGASPAAVGSTAAPSNAASAPVISPPSAAGTETRSNAISIEERGSAPPPAAASPHKPKPKKARAEAKPKHAAQASDSVPASTQPEPQRPSGQKRNETQYGF